MKGGHVNAVTVDMGAPELWTRKIPMTADVETFRTAA